MPRLDGTELDVFPLCLGGNVFGWTIDEERSFEVLDAYHAAGGNFIDTADIYGRRGPDGAGASEKIIGRWIAARGNRDRIVLATKVGARPDAKGLSRDSIRRGIAGSLSRLQTDRVDLYYAHVDDPETPMEETLAAFGELVAEGSIRHAGASNFSAPRLERAIELGGGDGMARYVALQPGYNLLDRADYEGELEQTVRRGALACVPYFGLARGFLTGKYRRDGPAVRSERAEGVRERYFNDRGFAVLDALDEVAARHETSVAAVALAWLMAKPTVISPIASATSMAQLAELLGSIRLDLSGGELDRLDRVSGDGSV